MHHLALLLLAGMATMMLQLLSVNKLCDAHTSTCDLQTADGYSWTTPDNITGFIRAAQPGGPAALPTERKSHAAVGIDTDLLILGGESNGELVQEMCMVDTEQQVASGFRAN